MGIKEFFKPNLGKIAIFVLLIIFGMTTLVLNNCFGGRLCPEDKVNYHYLFSCTFLPECITKSEALYLNLTQKVPVYVFFVLLSYLLSCLVVMLVKSIFNKK